MKVLVLMSSYNGCRYIREQIDSIVQQTGCKIKLIVRDDGSSDGTQDILREYEEAGKLKWIQGENIKPAKSFLTLLATSDSDMDYYAFSDQDDVWEINKISSAIEKIQDINSENPVLYCSNLKAVDAELNVLKDKILPARIVANYKCLLVNSRHLFGCTMVMNNPLRNLVAGFGVPQKVIMHDLWVGVIAAATGKIIYDSEPHIKYRQHAGNVVGAQLSFRQKCERRIRRIELVGISIADQAQELIRCLGEERLKQSGHLKYTRIVADYKQNIKNKFRFIINTNTGLSIKAYIFHVLLALIGKL